MCALKTKSGRRYRRRVGAYRGIDVKHDSSVIDFSVSDLCYNFDFSSGALKDGYGLEKHDSVPALAQRYWVYRTVEDGKVREQYLYQLSNGLLLFYDPETDKHLYLSGYSYGKADMLNYRLDSKDVLLISCEGSKLMTYNGKVLTTFENAPTIKSMALHYERLFVISPDEPYRVYFSDDLDPTNWNIGSQEAGFIELLDERGKLTKVVSFANYLYVFREHGISRVTASGGQSEFSVVNLFVSAGRIYPESIVKCGSVIMFSASDGIYRFDGYDCTRVLTQLDGLISGEACTSAFFNGKYYLSCPMNFNDNRKIENEQYSVTDINGLLVYDVTTGDYSVTRGMTIDYMSVNTFGSEDFLMASDSVLSVAGVIIRSGTEYGKDLVKRWESPSTDFGNPDTKKVLREVYIESNVEATLEVTGFDKVKFDVAPGRSRVHCNIAFDKLKIAIETSHSNCSIQPITVVYSEY